MKEERMLFFLIKHNTDYIHYTFIKNVSIFKGKRLSVLI